LVGTWAIEYGQTISNRYETVYAMPYEVLLPVLGIVAAIAFVMYRAQLLPFTAGTPGRRPVRATEPENPYPAVSIRCASGACAGAKSLKGRRYLGDEAPVLPLAECASSRCDCRYVHHVDRRTGNNDRRTLKSEKQDFAMAFGNTDLREGLGRRASDWLKAYQMNTSSNA
jgi:hypothetical protein